MQPEFCNSRTVRPGRWFVLLASTVIAATLTLVFWVQPAAAQGDPITIPLARAEPDLDGVCNSFNGEYADAAVFDFADAFGVTGKVYLKHDGASLYVCMIGASSVNSTVGPFGSVYLDTDNGKETFAEKEDLGLRVTIPASTLSAHRGTGSGNYTPDPTVTGWSAAANTGNADQAEWKIPLDLVSANRCDAFGIAVYHHWITAVGDDYGWPSNKFYDSPKTWQEARLGSNPCQGKIAYVYRVDTGTANAFKALLEGKGFTVQLVPMPTVLATDFTQFDLVIIADDTGDLSQWPMGTAGVSPEANHIRSANKPMLGIGEGGYAYFGKHGQAIGWPNGWHGPLDRVVPRNTGQSYWHTPTDFGSPPPSPQQLFTGPVNEVGIYLKAVTGVIELGTEPSDADHAPLIAEREECSQLWGFSGRPPAMTVAGRNLFVNAVVYGLASQCPQRPTPPDDCVVLEKSADPPAGTLVSVGAVITYKLKYTVKNDPACALARAVLEDKIPDRTLFVPGSATDGIVPGADRVLRWNVGPLAPGASGLKQFKVSVADSICNGQRTVVNQARLVTSLGVFASNVVTHPVDCPPVVPAGNEPPYAEDEIQIYPYPLITGRPTDVSVRIRNLSSMTETVRVTFESSPNNFGIGIPFGTLPAAGNPRVVTLPPFGIVEVKINWTPVKSGHYCIRVKIESPGRPAIFTYRNLDVMEDLRPGVTDTLTFSVGNPTAAVATVNLVVDNTCPGWVASVSPAQLLNMAPGEVRSATLSVIPPTDRPLGTACHIDVQGWIGDVLIGGIRKLDVPPVHLPPANPPWMEREIILIPDPPVLNQPGQLCIELQNPMPTPRVVNVEFRVAAFGAGIGFTPVGSLNNLTLPPNSIGQYCINWTPTPVSGGSLHRCIQVRLSQAGFRDQFSQRNVDVRRLSVGSLNELLKLNIPFTIGNPNDYTVPMDINKILIGLTPRVRPRITPDPPPELMAGQTMDFMLGFEMVPGAEVAAAGALAEDDFALGYGDTARVEVALVLDGEEVGGFSVELENHRLYLPAVRKP